MRISLIPFLAAALVASVAAVAAQDVSVLPRDEEALRAIDNAQLRIVRRANSQCTHSGEARFGEYRSARARACMMPLADRAVETSDDPALQAYHRWLPMGIRYDANRAPHWRKLVVR